VPGELFPGNDVFFYRLSSPSARLSGMSKNAFIERRPLSWSSLMAGISNEGGRLASLWLMGERLRSSYRMPLRGQYNGGK
jgi:hypothetical protein